jgi:phosphohistidine phosphatase
MSSVRKHGAFMDRLILFRHGKAEPDSESGEDFDRRLAPRGEAEAAQMGERLAGLGFTPDLVLVSAAQRTRDTWAAAKPALDEPEVRFEDELYHAEAGFIRRFAEANGRGRGTVMVVGHNPGLHELAFRLMVEGDAQPEMVARARRDFPPAAVAVFAIDGAGRASAEGLYFPGRP